MERGRLPSYSSSTLSSNSSSGSVASRSSSASYASIKSRTLSISSYTSKISTTSVKSVDFWNQFDRYSSGKRKSVAGILKNIFSPKQKGEPTKNASNPLLENDVETSFIEELNISTCPPGLYCVIDEFLTEYDLRLLEEEERAEMIAKKRTKSS
eukprot:GFUD01011310.1.p1 GENE.GFUD01011310.1~~GFUD01011310.1.p1  ORF type:complete len:154 (+),score=43.18 GFUD01011310.1:36-497(+)